MTREDFMKIIKLRSFWKIDRRKGNYKLPSGAKLRDYVSDLVLGQLELDKLGIAKNGDLYPISPDHSCLWIPFCDDEPTTPEEQDARFERLVIDIIC